MALYLAYKEVWRNRGRFFLFSLVISLITILVLFIAALAEGLALSNREYLQKIDAELLVFQQNVDVSINTSRLGRSKINNIRRVSGVQDAGSIGFATATLMLAGMEGNLNASIIGVEPGKPGAPPVVEGRNLDTNRSMEALIDSSVARRRGISLNDDITLKVIQGTKEEFYTLKIVGFTDGRKYLYNPSLFVPYLTWDRIQPQTSSGNSLVELISNVVAVKLIDAKEESTVRDRLLSEVEGIDVANVDTAIEALPGYRVQQTTLDTQQFFTLLIGVLVIGGFFQIQLLQKVPLFGVLKAIGTSNATIAHAVILQIVIVSTFGVLIGGLVTFLLSLVMPASTPILFNGSSVIFAIYALLLIGPLGGLVSVRLAVSIEPLVALGLSQ